MLPDEILRRRLAGQALASPQPHDVMRLVAQLGAVQAQDYPAARWALGQRLVGATDASVEAAFAHGQILRTHVLRPTWHFVAPADIRWMLALTAPRVKTAITPYSRSLAMDDEIVERSQSAFASALVGGRALTRAEIRAAMRGAGLEVSNPLLAHLLLRAELDALVCSGPPRGKQQTYALLEERVAPAPVLEGDAALVELTSRYFSSHGPATVQDCSWWSGLRVPDVRRGLELSSGFEREEVNGRTYWFSPGTPPPMPETALLLPNYDEYTVAYRHRGLFYDRPHVFKPGPQADVPFGNVIVIDGRVRGFWKRVAAQPGLSVQTTWFAEPSPAQRKAVQAAAERYADFLGRPPPP